MKRNLTIFLTGLLAFILVACWFALEIRAKLKYDQARQQNDETYSVVRMNSQATTFLSQVQS